MATEERQIDAIMIDSAGSRRTDSGAKGQYAIGIGEYAAVLKQVLKRDNETGASTLIALASTRGLRPSRRRRIHDMPK